MFAKKPNDPFEKVGPLKKPFAINIILAWAFCLLSAGTANIKSETNLITVFVLLACMASIANILFIRFKTKNVHLFYFLISIGGFLVLLIPFTSAFVMIEWNTNTLLIFWVIFILSTTIMMYIYYIGLKVELLERNVITWESKLVWRASYDIYADANEKYGRITNLIRNILAPFAPAVGMAFSRNSYVQQEEFVLGLVMLSLGLVMYSGYLRYLVLGLRFHQYQNFIQSEIAIIEK